MSTATETLDPTSSDVEADEPTSGSTGSAPRRSIAWALLAMALVGLGLAALIAAVVANDDAAAPSAVRIVAAPEAGAQLRSGDGEDVVPALIRLEPGQELVLDNQDWQPHTLGPLVADRGKVVKRVYATEGRYVTSTSLRKDGRVTILVEDTTP